MVLSAPKSLQLLGMHALAGCDGTSYPYAKGKVSALKTMLAGDFSDLDDVLGEEGVTQADLMKVAITFPIAMYGLPRGTSIESARFVLQVFRQRRLLQSVH